MPFYSQALTTYFTRVLKPDVQEMSTQIAWLLKQQEGNKALYRYTARELYDLFKSVPYYPDLEVLYVEIGREYIAGRPDMWDDTMYVKKVSLLVQLSALNLVGTKTTDLKLNDLAGNSLSLYDVQAAYTVLYFYNPECGSCAKITPEVHKMYQNYKNKGVQVFAVYIDRDQDVWRKYVVGNQYLDWINVWDADETAGVYNKYDLHAIPMIYLLDKDKVILKKDITEGQLDLWLDQLTE
jgi:thiol-disulfide isomerase/thioredoxin